MTAFLYRLGRFAHARPWAVIGAWIVLIAVFLIGGFGFGGTLADSFSVPGTESQQALDRLDAVFPQAAGSSAQAVVVAPTGTRIDQGGARTAVDAMVAAIKRIDGVESASSPYSTYATDAVSKDHRAAIIGVQFTGGDGSVPARAVTWLTDTASIGRDAGLRVAFSGQVFQTTSVGVSVTEGLGVLFAGVVMLVTFGSLLAAGLPLLTAVLGVGVSYAAIKILALFTDVSTSAPTLALMLGLAVGIDYGLFIISRHRQQLAIGMAVAESIPAAVATAGTAVVFAGTTVIIALVGLLIVQIPFLGLMGIGAAFAVLVAVAASVSLLPALLALGAARFVPKAGSRTARRALDAQAGRATTLGSRWVALVGKVPAVAVVLVIGVLGTLAIPAASLQLSLPNNGSQPAGTTARTAYDLTTQYFGEGRNGALVILADITQNNDFGTDLKAMKSRIAALPDVSAVGTPTPNASLDTAILQVIPRSGPASAQTVALVNRIRGLEQQFKDRYDIPIAVTGSTAVQIDVSSRLGNALLPFVLVVVGLSVVLLMAVFRSVVVPLKAAVGFLLSMLASLGVTVAVFQWGWGAAALGVEPGPLLSFLPVLVIAILFGLSMDYEVFIVSGMRETWVHSDDADLAVRRGFTQGARVVTAAALIMVFVFTSFIPEGSGVIKPIALSLAAGIVFDAFLVRMTLVPAVMLLFRRAAWYLPRWIDRVLPTIDIEGEGLAVRGGDLAWAEGERRWAMSSSNLVPVVPFDAEPLSVHAERGGTTTVQVPAASRRVVVATLTGHLAAASGRVQADGRVAPSDARELRLVAAPVFDDGTAWDATTRELVRERLRLAPRHHRAGSLGGWLERLPEGFADDAPLGELRAEERLVALALSAAAGGATVLVVDAGDIGRAGEQRLAALLDLLVDGDRTAVLVVAAGPERAALAPTDALNRITAS